MYDGGRAGGRAKCTRGTTTAAAVKMCIFKWGPKALSLCAIRESVGLKCRASTRLDSFHAGPPCCRRRYF